jgi:hypothetical protein
MNASPSSEAIANWLAVIRGELGEVFVIRNAGGSREPNVVEYPRPDLLGEAPSSRNFKQQRRLRNSRRTNATVLQQAVRRTPSR